MGEGGAKWVLRGKRTSVVAPRRIATVARAHVCEVKEPAQARDNLPSDMRDTRTWLDKLPLPWPYILGILLGVLVVLYVGLRFRQGIRAFLFRRELSAKTKGSKGTAKSKAKKRDLGVLGQKALSKLAAFKKEKAKEPLERMWERRSQGQAYYSDYTT